MSKKAKSEAKLRRRAQKRARKASEQAKYEAWKAAGQNTKSRRVKLRAKRLRRNVLRAHNHAEGPCGNIGCKHCNPIRANVVPVRFLHQAA
jgi:hypothetical protein